MLMRTGIPPLKYPRTKLLEILKKNRETHIEEYKKAEVIYRKAMTNFLAQTLRDFEGGKSWNHQVDVVQPINYAEHYDRAIKMFELTEESHIELDQEVFEQLVENRWSWAKFNTSSITSNSRYLHQ